MWTTQEGETEGKGDARRATGSEAESLDMWEGSLILLREGRGVWVKGGQGRGWGQPRGLTRFGAKRETQGLPVPVSSCLIIISLQTAGSNIHRCLSPKFTIMMMYEMSSRKYIILKKARQPAQVPYGRRGMKGGRRLSRTDRQWWTAALGNLDQVDSRIGAKRKEKKNGSAIEYKQCIWHVGLFPEQATDALRVSRSIVCRFPNEENYPRVPKEWK